MPIVAQLTGGRGRAGARQARDRAVATMTALAPMTRIVDLDIPAGRPATIARHSFGPVDLVHLRGLRYGQVATARTTDGVPEGISLGVRPAGTWTLSQGE